MKTGDRVKVRDRKYHDRTLNHYRGMAGVVMEMYPAGAAVMTVDGALLLRFENIIESEDKTKEEL